MTNNVIARVERVTHRYGKTLALNDLTLDIPAQCMAGMIGPDGVGSPPCLPSYQITQIQVGNLRYKRNMADGTIAERVGACPMPQGLGPMSVSSACSTIDSTAPVRAGRSRTAHAIGDYSKPRGSTRLQEQCGRLSGDMSQGQPLLLVDVI